MGIFKRREKKIYSLRKAMELAQDPKYKNYEFEPIDPEEIKAGYRMIPREQVREHIEEVKRNKRKEVFEKSITGDGSYKNIDRKSNHDEKAKEYCAKEFVTR